MMKKYITYMFMDTRYGVNKITGASIDFNCVLYTRHKSVTGKFIKINIVNKN